MRCRFSQENPDKPCFCSACHLSSQLFPRRQDGKIVLPELLSEGGISPSFHTNPQSMASDSPSSPSAPPPTSFHLSTPLMRDPPPPNPPVQAMFSSSTDGRAEPGQRPRARSNARMLGSGSSSARLRSGADTIAFPEISSSTSSSGTGLSTSKMRPRSQTFLTTTTAVSNPYPISSDTSYPDPSRDNRLRTPAPESSSALNSAPSQSGPTPPLKFCPPFVACDRIAISADSDAAKEGVTMIPWSVRRRKQKYRSGFDTGTGQGRGKTMFRYYGPDNDPPNSSPSTSNPPKK